MTETKTIISYPILFQGEMIQAMKEHRKTETRRTTGLKEINKNPDAWQLLELVIPDKQTKRAYAIFRNLGNGIERWLQYCPYGNIGNYLWVRETFAKAHGAYLYKDGDRADEYFKWKPSIHMPKEAARIWLKNKEIRVERLQDITEESAINEGVKSKLEQFHWTPGRWYNYYDYLNNDYYHKNPVKSFRTLWKSIHGPGSWERNDWLWVTKYEIVSTTGKPF